MDASTGTEAIDTAPGPVAPAAPCGEKRFGLTWRDIFIIEAAGVRTAAAATLPILVGQGIGYAKAGLMMGLGGLYVSLADKPGATIRTLLVATLGVAAAALGGALTGDAPIALATVVAFLLAFGLGMLGALGEVAGNLGFIVTLVFSVTMGLPTHLRGGIEHLADFAAGGVWATGLTLLLWTLRRRLGETEAGSVTEEESVSGTLPDWGRTVCKSFAERSPVFWHALRLAVASAVAVALYRSLHVEHGYWMLLTVLVIVKPEYAATRQRAQERIFGSVVGGALAVVLALSTRNVIVLDVLLVVFAILAFSHSPRNYGLYTLFLTPFVVLMIDIVAPGNWQIALTRVINTLAGGVLALLVTFALRSRTSATNAV